MTLLDQIRTKSKTEFRPATATEIQVLQALQIPEDAFSFYRNSIPAKTAEIGKVRLCNVAAMVMENRDAVPGYYAYPCGYVVFATTDCGDAICFNRHVTSGSRGAVVLIAHDLEPKDDTMDCEDLAKLVKPIATSFGDFLQAFVSETLDTEPLYPPFDSGKTNR
jgi:hypothetical protein